MILENLTVDKIAMHEIYKRGDDRKLVPPSFSAELEELPANALTMFQMRVTEALSAQSKSIEMRIVELGEESMVAAAEHLINEPCLSDDKAFLQESKKVAESLAKAQLARGVPGGVVVVFRGRFGVPQQSFVGVIKAETQSGFRRQKTAEAVITQFLDDIFLTPAQRLYKVGLMVAGKPEQGRAGWSVFVFDSNITASHRESAAQYFYESFLGCTFPENGAYETQRFFDLTKDFVRKSALTTDAKRDLNDALFTFVKSEQAPTFTSQEFSDKYFPIEIRDSYSAHLAAKQFPTRAVVRDVSDMGSRLKRRRFKFGTDIEFSVSPEALRDKLVDIKRAHAADLGGEGDAEWTQIVIRRPMTDQQ